jgi:YVTN family beta-propeller protein
VNRSGPVARFRPYRAGAWIVALVAIGLVVSPTLSGAGTGHTALSPVGAGSAPAPGRTSPALDRSVDETAATDPASASASTPIGEVGYTWDLANGTAFPTAIAPPLHDQPSAMTVVAATGTLWIAWGANPFGLADNVTLVNLSTNEVVGQVPGTENATNLLYEPSLGLVFVTQTTNPSGQGRVEFLNATTGAAVAPPVLVGTNPAGMAYDPYAGLLYVVSNGTDIATAISIPSGSVVDPFIPVGVDPISAAYMPLNGAIYVANYGSNNVTVLNGSTGRPTGPSIGFPSDYQPIELIPDPALGYLLVVFLTSFGGSGAIGLIDPSVNAAIGSATVANGFEPASAVLDPTTGLVVMPERSGPSALGPMTFDPMTLSWDTSRVSAYPPSAVGAYPTVEAIDASDQVLYVAHDVNPSAPGPTYLTTMNATNFAGGRIVLLGASARGGTYDPENGQVFVADSFTSTYWGSEPDSLAGFDAAGGPVLATIPIGYSGVGLSAGFAPQSVGYDPLTHELIVADGASGEAALLNASTGALVGNLSVPYLLTSGLLPNDSAPGASSVVYDPVHERIYLGDPVGGIVGYYASNLTEFFGVYDSVPPPGDAGLVHDFPYQTLTVDPSTGTLFDVAPSLDSGLGAISARDPFETGLNGSNGASLGNGTGAGSAIAWDPVDGSLYVTDAQADVVYVLNASTLADLEEVPVGKQPVAIAFDPVSDSIVVANSGSANLTILNGTSPASALVRPTSLAVAPGPSSLVVDPAQDTILVGSSVLGTVQAVSPAPEIFSYGVDRRATDVGLPVTLSAVATGGVGAFQYAYTGLPPGCSSENTARLVCAPLAPGTFNVTLTVSDSGPFTVSRTVGIVVVPDPTISITATSRAVDVGLPFGASAEIANGTAPLVVLWNFGDGGNATGSSAQHVFERTGTYPVSARVTDALGSSAESTLIVGVGATLSTELLGPGSGHEGSPVSLNGSAIDGVAPYRFTWTFGDGASVQTGVIGSSRPNSSEVSHTYASEGTFHVTLLVQDGGGERSLSSWNVTIGGALPPPPSGGTSGGSPKAATSAVPPTLLAGDLVALVLVAAAGTLWLRRRRPPTAKPSTDGPDASAGTSSDPPIS